MPTHADPIAPVILGLAIVLGIARLGGELMHRLGQPAVLGELLAGVVLGNLPLVHIGGLAWIDHDAIILALAHLGVLLLLFEVGLESSVSEMLAVGPSSLLVAVIGVAAPFVLGWAVASWLMPTEGMYAHVFLGATLTATSVGITARVLHDLGRARGSEARVILGAAVIDDVLGLVILAAVVGAIEASEAGRLLSGWGVGAVLAKAVGFLAGAIIIGRAIAPRIVGLAARMRARGALLTLGFVFCFALSWLASVAGLATIIGAFAAGLVLDRGRHDEQQALAELVRPISGLFVPVFFVVVGMQTDLATFAQPGVLGFAAALTIAAVVGKQAGAFGVRTRNVDRLSVAVGMVPRGEVGLIFASIGETITIGGKPVISEATFSAIVMMVIVTTLATPPALRWSLSRGRRLVAAGHGD